MFEHSEAIAVAEQHCFEPKWFSLWEPLAQSVNVGNEPMRVGRSTRSGSTVPSDLTIRILLLTITFDLDALFSLHSALI